MRDGSVMASLPCNLKGQTVYLLVFQLLFIYYIGVWKRKEKRLGGSRVIRLVHLGDCFVEFFHSLPCFKSIFSRLFSPSFNLYQGCSFGQCVDEETVLLLSCTSGVFVISFSIDMHQWVQANFHLFSHLVARFRFNSHTWVTMLWFYA